MKLLLDTHTVLWLLSEPELLPARVLDAVMSPTNTLLLSIVSLWEMTIKSAKGSLRLPAANIDMVAAEVQVRGIALLQFVVEYLVSLEALPLIHKDPFDRALVAQARRHDVTLVSVDRVLGAYGVDVLWA